MKKYAVVLLAALLAVGCSRQDDNQPTEHRIVQIVSEVAKTKSSKTLAVNTTELNAVRFLKLDGPTAPETPVGATPFLGNRAANGNITWTGTAPTYALDNQNAYFVAYYPAGVAAGSAETADERVDWTIDGKTDILRSAVWDAGTYTAPITGAVEGQTPLVFEHELAQLSIVFRAEANQHLTRLQAQYGPITGVKLLRTLPTATYTYATKKVSFWGEPTDIPLAQADCETKFEPIDIPESTNDKIGAGGIFAPSKGAFRLIVSTAKYPILITLAVQLKAADGLTDKDFEAGKKHIVTITFNLDKGTIEVSNATIVDWTDRYTANSDVNI